MKNYLWTLLILILLISCGQSGKEKISQIDKAMELNSTNNFSTNSNDSINSLMISRNEDLKDEFKNFKIFNLNIPIIGDFNGDKIDDRAEYKNVGGQSGITITDGKTKRIVRLGFGERLGLMTDFNWVNYWGLLKDSTTTKINVDENTGDIIGGVDFKLDNVSIFVRVDKSEDSSGGGVITYKDKQYIWIQQSE